jgi:hypothetical protein
LGQIRDNLARFRVVSGGPPKRKTPIKTGQIAPSCLRRSEKKRLLTGGLLVRVQPEEPIFSSTYSNCAEIDLATVPKTVPTLPNSISSWRVPASISMQLVADGPDIPLAVMDAHEGGRLVLFCGAGVSARAGLPMFGRLVEEAYERLGTTRAAAESSEWEKRNYDRVLGLLEGRFSPQQVRGAVRAILNTPADPELGTHRAILDLSRDRNGHLHLVSTNFDLLFQATEAGLIVSKAPELPIPKLQRWNSLVQLHGRMGDDDPNGEHLVLTSADFGRAYLVERWASRFVCELFNNFTVLFVGYSVDDPVMRYIVDALAAERARERSVGQERTNQAFAFAAHAAGQHATTDAAWRAKSIEPILYDERERHRLLHQTLETWASLWRGGVASKISRVREFGPRDPAALSPEDISVFCWAVSDQSGAPANGLADSDSLASLSWLSILESRLPRGLNSIVEDLTTPMVCEAGRRSPPAMDAVHRQIAAWLAKHVANPALARWVVGRGSHLHPEFAGFIEHELQNAGGSVPDAVRRVWRTLTAPGAPQWQPEADRYQPFVASLTGDDWSATLRLGLLSALAPRLAISPQRFPLSEEPGAPVEVDQILSVECELQCGDRREDIVDAFRSRQDHRRLAVELGGRFANLLLDAMDLQAALGAASPEHDRSSVEHPSIEPHAQNSFHHGWTTLIDLVRESFDISNAEAPDRAQELVRSWVRTEYPVFRRLVLYAASKGVTV